MKKITLTESEIDSLLDVFIYYSSNTIKEHFTKTDSDIMSITLKITNDGNSI